MEEKHSMDILELKKHANDVRKGIIEAVHGAKAGHPGGSLSAADIFTYLYFEEMNIDPENPKIIEDFIRAIGAEPVIYPYRNECCGGYISLKEKEMSKNMCEKIMDSAEGFGAQMLTTACPLCLYNLNKSTGKKLPVVYFTELLAEALGVKEEVPKS